MPVTEPAPACRHEAGPAYLFFGCRKAAADYIYADELREYASSGVLDKLFVAFSRDGPQKDYVQHHMLREGGLIAPVLDPQGAGHFYVCGDAKNMARVGVCFCSFGVSASSKHAAC